VALRDPKTKPNPTAAKVEKRGAPPARRSRGGPAKAERGGAAGPPRRGRPGEAAFSLRGCFAALKVRSGKVPNLGTRPTCVEKTPREVRMKM